MIFLTSVDGKNNNNNSICSSLTPTFSDASAHCRELSLGAVLVSCTPIFPSFPFSIGHLNLLVTSLLSACMVQSRVMTLLNPGGSLRLCENIS